MDEPIPFQVLGVSYSQEGKGRGRESLLYSPSVPDTDAPAPEVLHHAIRGWAAVESSIEQVRRCVEELVRRALVGETREGCALEAAARDLAMHVLPPRGVARILSPGFHPQFDIVQDRAAEIPWELLEDPRPICPVCRETPPGYDPAHSAFQFCPVHREELRAGAGKLAQRFHLTHLSRGHGRTPERGAYFLFVEDPRGDLAHPDRDRAGICRDHLPVLREQIERIGYRIHVLSGRAATRGRFREAIADPDVAGIYYFGHGHFPKDEDEGFLALADGELSASDVTAAGPAARFVFLNACEGAAGGPVWGLEKRGGSVAEAFARGGGKVVVAPLWPVVNVQAAQSALEFFKHAGNGAPLGHAMMAVREWSLQQYEQNQPHISWMAYRFYGDPNRRLPQPRPISAAPDAAAPPPAPSWHLFSSDGMLDADAFAFDITSILLRADCRRESHRRDRVSITDFVTGLVRKGDLLRHILRQSDIDPDVLYSSLMCQVEPGAPAQAGAEMTDESTLLAPSPANAQLPRRAHLTEDLVDILTTAAETAKPPGIGAAISERHVHEAITAAGLWGAVPGLPLGLQSSLRGAGDSLFLDDNGRLLLSGLEADALAVIETAHTLAQQRGVFPITHRVMLAALLADPRGHAARLFTAAEVDPKLMFAIMLAKNKETQQGRHQFALSSEACGRIVGPMIQEARRQVAAESGGRVPRGITPRDLFAGFCSRAAVQFKDAMRIPPLPFDLDVMAVMDPQALEQVACDQTEGQGTPLERSQFDDVAWRILVHAAQLAAAQGHGSIRSPHLFVALIDEDAGTIQSAIRRAGRNAAKVRRAALDVVKTRPFPVEEPFLFAASAATFKVLERAVENAAASGLGPVTPSGLLHALFADGGGTVGQMLNQIPPD